MIHQWGQHNLLPPFIKETAAILYLNQQRNWALLWISQKVADGTHKNPRYPRLNSHFWMEAYTATHQIFCPYIPALSAFTQLFLIICLVIFLLQSSILVHIFAICVYIYFICVYIYTNIYKYTYILKCNFTTKLYLLRFFVSLFLIECQ